MAVGPDHPDDTLRRGTEEAGKKTYAWKKNGRKLVVRIYNSITK